MSLRAYTASMPPVTDISGHWEGTITRDEGGGKRSVFQMEMDVVQQRNTYKGTSYVHYNDGRRDYHATMDISGKVSGTFVRYKEARIYNYDVVPGAEWCLKEAELIFSLKTGSTPTLEGIWDGTTPDKAKCVPGRIFLQKKPPRA